MTTSTSDTVTNPYVGPRTFSYADRKRFFGRETEAASLLARVISERLLLFYAQSGAGKSSLINARLIPRLREEEGFSVLPVGRVAGQLPSGVEQADNIFLFNLMSSLDQGGSPAQWARLNLNDFLEHLVTDDGLAWRYDPAALAGPGEEEAAPAGDAAPDARFALVIDQFEEIITGHPDRWREREDFFRQLDAALQANPNLWVVLSLREDYVAALDPYAQLLFNRLRARFYMERMGEAAGLEAIRKPAELGGRPFAAGVAEKLVDDLCQVRITGQEGTVPGQYVEPVQLQVVWYQLWENLARGTQATEGIQITFDDLAVAGDVNLALAQFYEETLALALADPAAAGVNERRVRAWFDEELITEAGTRGLVHQGTRETGSLPNGVVGSLQKRFLVRGEARGGDTWIELVHDRFVEPIQASNRRWLTRRRIREHSRRNSVLWTDAQVRMKEGNIIPFISSRLVNEMIHKSGQFDVWLKEDYAVHVDYPFTNTSLDMLTQYRAATIRASNQQDDVRQDDVRREYYDFLMNVLYQVAQRDGVHDSVLEAAWESAGIMTSGQLASALGFPHFDNSSAGTLETLVSLPLPIFVTTSPLQMLESALRLTGKMPHSDYCGLRPRLRDHLQVEHIPSVAEPLVFHLFGLDEIIDSIVLTRSDLLNFIGQMSRWTRDETYYRDSPFPSSIRQAFTYDAPLILGYQHDEWEFKALTEAFLRPYSGTRAVGVVQIQADERARTEMYTEFLNAFYADLRLKSYWGSAPQLIAELNAQGTGE